ncbi:MAG TPA: dTMP kinase [Actinomycetota bacterium]|nr:dTMP kinase [Actinomycetota bacterium]
MASVADEVAALRGTRPATFKDLLTHPAFSRLLAAMTISSLGDWVGFVAVTTLVTRLSGSVATAGFAIGAVMIARMLPAVLFGPIAGALVDRVDRKHIMMLSDVGRGTMYAAMAFVGELWAIFLLSFAIECLSLLWSPARDATLPNMVPRRQLGNANAIGLVSTYATLPLGAAVFSLLAAFSSWVGARVPWLGARPESLALLLDAGTFAFSAFMVSRIAFPPSASRSLHGRLDLGRVWRDVVDGLRFLREDSIASAMTAGIVVAFAAVGAVLAVGPIFVSTLDADAAAWGIIVTAFGIGMGLGMAAANQVAKVVDRGFAFVWALVAAAGALFVLASMPNLSLAAVVCVWLGAFCGLAWVSGYTLLQENVEDEYRGRTFASLTTLSRLGLFMSLTLFPILSSVYGDYEFYVGGQRFDLSGTRLALWTAGALAAVAGLNTRRLLHRHRLSRPQPLMLVPKLKRPPSTGLFIAFEGVEGAGKGTQIRLAEEYLRDQVPEGVLVTREPGGTELGEKIREVLLDPETGKLDARSEALLFAAARAQMVSSVIRPALAEGKVVICDRYVDSSLAYQGWGRGLGEQDVLTLNVWATQGLFPDLVILLHLEPERGLLRSTEAPDRMELEGQDFHSKVADAYLKIAEEHPERFVLVDADQSPAEVFDDVRAALDKAIEEYEDSNGVDPST